MDEELARLASVASLAAQLSEVLTSPQVAYLAADGLRRDLSVLNARALAEIADREHPPLLRLVRPSDQVA